MPTFRHGKSTAVLVNQYNLSAYLNEATSTSEIETGETSTFGSSAKTYIPGLRDATISASGLYESASTDAVDTVLQATITGSGDDVATVAPEGLTVGRRAVIGTSETTSYEVSASVGDVVSVTADFQISGGLDSGLVLAAATTVTTATTTNGTSQDNTASSANGGSANLHVTANTWSGATTVKVQHSTDNSTWVDLIAFTSVSASTLSGQRATVTGTVNRYVRAIATTAAGSGSITYTVAFARR